MITNVAVWAGMSLGFLKLRWAWAWPFHLKHIKFKCLANQYIPRSVYTMGNENTLWISMNFDNFSSVFILHFEECVGAAAAELSFDF